LRVVRTRQVFDRTDLGIVVTSENRWNEFEEGIVKELKRRDVPVVVAVNKRDRCEMSPNLARLLSELKIPHVALSAHRREGVLPLRALILETMQHDTAARRPILADLVGPGGCAVLVVPVDKEAPAGRLILPQAQAVRDLLDHNAMCLVLQDRELAAGLARLKRPPDLVVTDSQAFARVSDQTPPGIPLTSFSILFARRHGDLTSMAKGACAIDGLKTGDRVLIAETCTHHPVEDDIGTVKLPAWLEKRSGSRLAFSHVRGHDFPADLREYALVVHCGACMGNRREMVGRIRQCADAHIPITNYGLAIAFCLGILERALGPFPEALEAIACSRSPNR
jgi:[FeFe] hydrogenase H-cluster maturation GTPase HydF